MSLNWTDEHILAGVTENFRALSAVPHPSGQEAAAAGLFRQRLEALGAVVETDQAGNLRADLPATPGKEGLPLTILQGHMDMVCAVAPGSGFDPEKDSVTIQEADGFLCSDGRSSLGADNNLGNAAAVFLLEEGAPHGPLRIILTVREEQGLLGAQEVDKSWLEGARYLINTDGFRSGTAVVSSASGLRESWEHPLTLRRRSKSWAYRLSLDGFRGGHSGDDIGKGRANPIQMLAGFLRKEKAEVAEFSGGHSFNAIPMSASALVAVDDPDAFRAHVKVWEEGWKKAYEEADPEGQLTVEAASLPRMVWQEEDQTAILDFLARLTIGVYAMREDMPGCVMTSANLGRAWAEDGVFRAAAFIRSSDPEKQKELRKSHIVLSLWNDFTGTTQGYPAWPGGRSNPLARFMSGLYEARTGKPLDIQALHVGLEPSIFLEKNPGLTMVSVGADVLDPHSVSERVPLASIPPFVRLLADTLDGLDRV